MADKPKARVALVVDDEHFARLFVLQILVDRDFVVLEAGDSSEAWEMLRANEDVSVLITDIAMPGSFNGLELARRASEANPDLGVVLVSGHAPPPSLPSPEHVFVAKPYTPRALLEALAMTALGSTAAI